MKVADQENKQLSDVMGSTEHDNSLTLCPFVF